MQKDFITIARNQLRLLGAVIILAIAFSVFSAFRAKKLYGDIWQQLGITKIKGDENIQTSFLNGYFNYYGAEKAKNILAGNRAAVARDLMIYTKQYVNSELFKKEYSKLREGARPQEPEQKIPNKEEVRKEKIAEVEKSLAESNKTIKEFPEMAKTLEPVVEMLKTTLKDYKDPNSENIEAYYQYEINEQEYRMKSYKDRLSAWEKEYPANHSQLIKERLKKFISLAKTVDFNAELKTVGDKKKFVNKTYEAKPYDWKQIYRAGKEVIEPAVAFAEEWIKEK